MKIPCDPTSLGLPSAMIYLSDGAIQIETVNASGSEVASFTRTQKIDETLAEVRSSTTGYYQADGLGSLISLSGPSGTLAAAVVSGETHTEKRHPAARSGRIPDFGCVGVIFEESR